MNRLRPKVSLGTLLLLLTVLVLGFSHIHASRQLSLAKDELLDLRYQYGVLVVDDPSRPHVLRYASQENPWKWHIYLPDGQNYKLMCGVGTVPNDAIPDATTLQHVQETWVVGDGKRKTVFVSLTPVDGDTLKFTIGGDGSQTVSQHIAKDDIYDKSVFDVSSMGSREAFVAEQNSPFVLFSQTERNLPTAASPNASAKGVVVWLAPVD